MYWTLEKTLVIYVQDPRKDPCYGNDKQRNIPSDPIKNNSLCFIWKEF